MASSMTLPTDAKHTSEATQRTDTESRLYALIERGFQFVHPRDARGEVVAVVGIRAHDNVIDVVRLDGEDDVVATRIPGSESDVLEPQTVLWRTSGMADAVLDEVLALGDEYATEHGAGTAKGCWVAGSAGRAKWLAATG